MKRLKVLVLSRNYPNDMLPHLGLWTEGFVRAISQHCDVRVIAPVPYCPPLPSRINYTRFRRITHQQRVNGIEVLRPRFLVGPGYALHNLEAEAYDWGVRGTVARLHRAFPFDIIHAHFSYPDGVVAARLGQRYRVPVFITEQAPWRPWMDAYPRVRRQAVWAAERCAFHFALSRYGRDTIAHFTGDSDKLRVMPNGVDGTVFMPLPGGGTPDPNRILYVGQINFTKGVDVLLKAMRALVDRRPQTRLTLVGGSFYKNKLRQEQRIRNMAQELGLSDHVEFVGEQSPRDVAGFMRNSALLVLPSRAESFGAVLVEALACGIPVVASQSGGPADIVNEKVGVLVPTEDAVALVSGIEHILTHHEQYKAAQLRAYALANFSWESIAARTLKLYDVALNSAQAPQPERVPSAVG